MLDLGASEEGQVNSTAAAERGSDRREVGASVFAKNASLDTYFAQLSHLPRLSPDEEYELARRRDLGDTEAERRLVEGSLRVVISIAARYARQAHGLDLADLIQEGNVALVCAARMWEPSSRFVSYAYVAIDRAIIRAIDNSRFVRLPVYIERRVRKVGRVSRNLEETLGREPTLDEISAKAEMQRQEVEALMLMKRSPISLDQPVAGDASLSWEDLLESDHEDFAEVEETSVAQAVHEALRRLHSRQRRVLELRYGLNGYEGREQSNSEIAASFGTCQQYVNRLRNEAGELLRTQSPELVGLLEGR